MSEQQGWRVTVKDEFGKWLLWGLYDTRDESRREARRAREHQYPTRIRKVVRQEVRDE